MAWKDAPLSVARGYRIAVARVPRNFGIAHDYGRLVRYYAATTFGELVVRSGGCDGVPVGTFPLADPASAPNRFEVAGELPKGTPDGDLCMTFTASAEGPLYVVGQVTLEPAR
jgi:hexosaminidase